jgi:hypothetical protein
MRPFSGHYGRERGEPIDRRYIDAFLAAHSHRIRGDVLEVREPQYARLGHAAVRRVHVVDIDPSNRRATIVADLAARGSLPEAAIDCAIVTQTLQFLDDVESALANLRQALRAEGTLLLTVPSVSKLDHEAPTSDHWRWTPAGLERLLSRAFPGDELRVEGHGNLLTSVAFLLGLAQEELSSEELAYDDPTFPLVACARVDRRS